MLAEWEYILAGDMSWDGWFRVAAYPSNAQPLISSKGPNFDTDTYSTANRRRYGGIYLESDGKIELRVNAGSEGETVAASLDEVALDTWFRVTASFSKSQSRARLFVNGMQAGSTLAFNPSSSDLLVQDGEVVFGGSEGGTAIDGAISNIGLWDIELAMDRMPSDLKTCRVSSVATGLLGDYNLNQNDYTSAARFDNDKIFKPLESMDSAGASNSIDFGYLDGYGVQPPRMCNTSRNMTCLPPEIWCF